MSDDFAGLAEWVRANARSRGEKFDNPDDERPPARVREQGTAYPKFLVRVQRRYVVWSRMREIINQRFPVGECRHTELLRFRRDIVVRDD